MNGTYLRKYKAKLWNPHDIILRDNIYVVTDKSNSRVVALDKDSLELTNEFNSTDAIYKSNKITEKFDPYGVAYTGNSFVVTDLKNHCVVEFTGFAPAKVFGQDMLTRPTGITVDSVNRKEIYVADAEEDCIFVFDQEHIEHEFKHKIGEGQLHKPWFMAINSVGNLVVAEVGNHRVQVFDPKSRISVQIIDVKYNNKTWDCRGLALDVNDDIYVSVRCGWLWETVVVYSSSGDFLGNFGGAFDRVRGLTVTRQGNNKVAYVLDGARHSICAYKIKDKRKNTKTEDKSTPKQMTSAT